ncbi:hypothetical protein K470DRAFT_203895, partial [Piedraia hortae CBS 480.64]
PSQVFNQQDHKAQFVSCLVTTTTDLVQHIWPNSANADPLPLDKFIEEVLRRSRMSYSTLQTALYYIADDEDNHPHPQQKRPHQKQLPSPLLCGRRMFLTALILATKYLQDKTYSLKAWSKMSGLRIAEIVALERLFLQTVQWNLHIPATKFRCFTSSILKYT